MIAPLDSLLQASADAIAERDREYIASYTNYLNAVRAASQALIKMNRTKLPTTRAKAEKKYLGAMETWVESRGKLDDAQIARINTHATYAQIVKLISEELVPKVNDARERLAALEQANETSGTP